MKRFLNLSGSNNQNNSLDNSNNRARSSTAGSSLSTYSTATAATTVSLDSLNSSGSPNRSKNKTTLEQNFHEFLKWTDVDTIALPLGPIQAHKLNKLQKAVLDNNVTRAKALIKQKKRDVNKVDTVHGFTALHIAASFNLIECALLLIKAPTVLKLSTGSSQMSPNPHYRPAYQSKKGTKNLTIISLKTCNVNAQDRKGRTPLMLAVIGRHIEMVKLLLENNASFNITDQYGVTSQHYALLVNDVPIVQLMLHKRAPTALLDVGGYTLLQHALRLKREEIAGLLIQRGVFINEAYSNEAGKTPLHLAIKYDLTSVAKLLLQHGAKLDARDFDGKTPRDYVNPANTQLNEAIEYCLTHKSARNSQIETKPDAPADSRASSPAHLADPSELEVSNISDMSETDTDTDTGARLKEIISKVPLSQESIIPEEDDIEGVSEEYEDKNDSDDLSSVEHTNLDDADLDSESQNAHYIQDERSNNNSSQINGMSQDAKAQGNPKQSLKYSISNKTMGVKSASVNASQNNTEDANGNSELSTGTISFAHLFKSGGLQGKSVEEFLEHQALQETSKSQMLPNSDLGSAEKLRDSSSSGILSELGHQASTLDGAEKSIRLSSNLKAENQGLNVLDSRTDISQDANHGSSTSLANSVSENPPKRSEQPVSSLQDIDERNAAIIAALESELQQVLKDKQTAVCEYQQKLDEAEDQLMQLQSKRAEAIVRMYDELNQVHAEYELKEKDLTEAQAQLEKVSKTLRELEDVSSTSQTENEQLKLQIEQLRTQKRNLESEAAELDTLNAQLKQITDTCNKLQAEIATKNEQIQKLEGQWQNQVAALSVAKNETETIGNKEKVLQTELETKNRQCEYLNEEINKLKSQINSQEAERLNSENLQSDFEKYRAHAEATIARLESQKSQLVQEQQSYSATTDQVQEKIEALHSQLQKEKLAVEQYKRSIIALNAQTEALSGELKSKEDDLSAALREAVAQKNQIQQFTLDKVRLEHQLDLMSQKLSAEQELSEQKSRQLDQLKTSNIAPVRVADIKGRSPVNTSADHHRVEITKYYEREIENLAQSLKEEKKLREEKEKESLAVSDALNDLELNLTELKSMYENEVSFSKQLKSVKARLMEELTAAQQETAQTQQKLHEQSLEHLQMKYAAQELEIKLTKEQQKVQELEANRNEALQKLAVTEDRLKIQENVEASLNQKMSKLQAAVDEQRQVVADAAARCKDYDLIISQKTNLETQIQTLTQLNNKLESEIAHWETQSNFYEAKIKDTESILKTKLGGALLASDKNSTVETAIDHLKSEIRSLKDQLDSANATKRSLEHSVNQLKETLRKTDELENAFTHLLERSRPILQNRLVLKSNLKEISAALVSAHNSRGAQDSLPGSPILGAGETGALGIGNLVPNIDGASIVQQCQFLNDQLGSSWKALSNSVASIHHELSHDAGKWEGAFGNGEGGVDVSLNTSPSNLIVKKLLRSQNQRVQETLTVFKELEAAIERISAVGQTRFHKLLATARSFCNDERSKASAATMKIIALKNAMQQVPLLNEADSDVGEQSDKAATAQELFEKIQRRERQATGHFNENDALTEWDLGEDAVAEIERRVFTLQQNIVSAQRKLKEARSSREVAIGNLSLVEKELAEARKKSSASELQLEKLRQENSRLNAEFQRQKERLAQVEKSLNENFDSAEKHKSVSEKKDRAVQNLEKQISKMTQDLALTKKELEHAQEKHSVELATVKMESDQANRQLADLSQKLKDAQTTHANNNGEASTLKAMLQANESKIQALTIQLTSSADVKAKIEAALSISKRKVQSLETSLQKAQLELEMVKTSAQVPIASPLLIDERSTSPVHSANATGVDPSVSVLQTLLGQIQSILAGWTDSASTDGTPLLDSATTVENLKHTVSSLSDRLYDAIAFIRDRSQKLAKERLLESQIIQREINHRKEFQEKYEATSRQLAEDKAKWSLERDSLVENVRALKGKEEAYFELRRRFDDERAEFRREEAKWKDAKESWAIERGGLVAKREDLEKRMSEIREDSDATQRHADTLKDLGKRNFDSFKHELGLKEQEISQYKETARRVEALNNTLLQEKQELAEKVQHLGDVLVEKQNFYKQNERQLQTQYGEQLAELFERLEHQAKERSSQERSRLENEQRLQDTYERQVESLSSEIATLRDVIESERAGKTAYEILAKDKAAELQAENNKMHSVLERVKSQNVALNHKLATMQSQLNEYHIRTATSTNVSPASNVSATTATSITRHLEREIEQLKGLVIQAVKTPSSALSMVSRSMVPRSTASKPGVALYKESKRFELIDTAADSLISKPGVRNFREISPSSARTLISSPLHSPTAISFAAHNNLSHLYKN